MRDYNQINLGKLRSPPKKGGVSLVTNNKNNNKNRQQQPPYSSHEEEEKKVDDSAFHSPKESSHASLSTAPSTPTTSAMTDDAMEEYRAPSLEAANITSSSAVGGTQSSRTAPTPLSSSSSVGSHPSLHSQNTNHTQSLSASDALSLRREGAEATIVKLRSQLDQAGHSDTSAQSALAKSDAVILELRSSVRQLKRQLERVTDEKQQLQHDRGFAVPNSLNGDALDARVGELQVQLDRAHAQILTADMVRKELEDTLEAEQYTWELRVQDQERQIQEMQYQIGQLVTDLESTRAQWKQAEDSWLEEAQELKRDVEKAQQEAHQSKVAAVADGSSRSVEDAPQLQQKIATLEQERTELQSCLDEALKELEAVDEELKSDNSAMLRQKNRELQSRLEESASSSNLKEPLQHLHRLVLERDGMDDTAVAQHQDPRDIISAIHQHIDSTAAPASDAQHSLAQSRQQVRQLESKIISYQRDLEAREESTAELRSSLKEAVSLLKPLQDTVAKSDREKARLQQQIQQLHAETRNGGDAAKVKELQEELALQEKELERLRQEVQTLEIQLTRERAQTATNLVQSHTPAAAANVAAGVGESKARARLRAKRAEEAQLKQMLDDARHRFRSMHQQSQDAEALNSELQARLNESPRGDAPASPVTSVETETLKQELAQQEAKLQELKDELAISQGELAQKEVELRDMDRELSKAKESVRGIEEEDRVVMDEARGRVQDLESKLQKAQQDLRSKKETEKALNRSLKEALTLLRPLQLHLEEAEDEKRKLAAELDALRGGGRGSDSSIQVQVQHVRDLEYAVTQLEKENSQLHDALEDMSQSVHTANNAASVVSAKSMQSKNEGRLKEEIVELKSRYEVTQSRLQDAFVENQSLVEALKKREEEEKSMIEELHVLRKRLDARQGDSGAPQDRQSSSPHVRPGGRSRLNY
uniref:Uncharacterized protein n=1 Tax=Entomoneis paludosa TaxID=265537 RepID=A0A7S2Y9Y2_9STRA|mmetsp:Transcript_24335/g.50587  ORF Transcript_24335/g.50587 Transcript_24335/m.50587 type:complete len:937 (+) Transcript_24335:645-3455(+)|eukprot:CAMPEP_0172461340 /NCGR_PEP_ID=MMETSP1065-20121228/40105_1 /TAXON_ID=265537 /ORGANISM="Amphiprora paludosa, Strain CCMP125" /LENGTH=936 /DNA_ID=CAMNT_0013216615 /DNA_START=537 /DNA_END=3347 /DNA_ORIENTATION=-